MAAIGIQSIEKPNAEDYNLIADSKGGDPNSVLVVDAHLDAIFGAGMLDNASGSATILDIAQMMRKVRPAQFYAGLPSASGWRAMTRSRNAASAVTMSSMV